MERGGAKDLPLFFGFAGKRNAGEKGKLEQVINKGF
jgi:hypothetical protein